MIPAGYMLKRVSSRPAHISNASVKDVYSVSGCISEFASWTKDWWFFARPETIDVTEVSATELPQLTLFYYEMYEREFDECSKTWSRFEPLNPPVKWHERISLQGFDVISFSAGQNPECSPLSCNSLANELDVNPHCLFSTFEHAMSALETGKFDNVEPGPFRIFAVYTVGR